MLDPLIALLVAVNILRLGWRVFRDSVGGLMDESLATAEVERIAAIVRREMGGALQFHDLRTRRAGPRPFVELHLVVPGTMRVDAAHEICDRIETAVERELPGAHVVVHVEPESELRRRGARCSRWVRVDAAALARRLRLLNPPLHAPSVTTRTVGEDDVAAFVQLPTMPTLEIVHRVDNQPSLGAVVVAGVPAQPGVDARQAGEVARPGHRTNTAAAPRRRRRWGCRSRRSPRR